MVKQQNCQLYKSKLTSFEVNPWGLGCDLEVTASSFIDKNCDKNYLE